MFETARYEASRRLRGTAGLSVSVSVYAVFLAFFFQSLPKEQLRTSVEIMPPSVLDAFGIVELSTIEGWLAAEVYTFVVIWALGIYFAYTAAGLIADDIEHDRMDLLMLLPFSRSRLLVEKFASILVPIFIVNGVLLVVVYVTALGIGEPVDPIRLVMVHLLAIPYLLTCAGIGIYLSTLTVFNRATVAQGTAVGVIALLNLIGIFASGTVLSWMMIASPREYYNPAAILIEGNYNLVSAGILLIAAVVLVLVSQRRFQRRDID
ncbi:ABC transporter permease subunit [Halorarum halobium]|uniref:ABC transporter permease subunit n=1 Tax=Halorarum halobium TaxID=3075121 RepID=UPI0028AD3F15|nr:ABC transporter permease subunit [Halobaculum sp. XH14]